MITLVGVAGVVAAGYFVPGVGLNSGSKRASSGPGSDAPTHGCRKANVPAYEDLAAAEAATLCLLNAERRAHGRSPLRANRLLRAAALRQSRDMVDRHFFEHVNPDGLGPYQRIAEAGYRITASGGVIGENLGYGEETESTPAGIVDGWMHSPGHRRNILRPDFREIGIGIVPRAVERSQPDNEGATYTTTFGRRGTP